MNKTIQLQKDGINLYPVIKPSTICVGISNDFTITSTNETKLNLDTIFLQIGSRLTLDNGRIIIGEGITYIRTSVSAYVTTGITTSNLMHCMIKLNGVAVNQKTLRVTTNYNTLSTATKPIEVEEGDVIEVYIRNQTTAEGIIGNQENRTYLTVEVI